MTDEAKFAARADGHPVLHVPSAGYLTRLHHRLRDRLPLWVIYKPVTREYPGRWVARMHVIRPDPRPTRFVLVHDTLDDLRDMLPPGLVNLGRQRRDVPEIAEVWL